MKRSYKTKNDKKAFTLIELLIVIAIIGILFIVLVSRVDFATDKAKMTGVQTDFRSFQVAFDQVAKENAGFNMFGWDTGDANGDRIRNSYDRGDTNKNGKEDPGETFIGRKAYGEDWTTIYTMLNPDTTKPNDTSAFVALEHAINANLDPKLHITITPDVDDEGKLTGDATITMANQARDPWKNEYHGVFITNAQNDGQDRGAIIMYSDGANGVWGSAHDIANGLVSITIPGNNIAGQDDFAIVSCYTYLSGYGEVKNMTWGFSNNINMGIGSGTNNNNSNNGSGNGSNGNDENLGSGGFSEIETETEYTFLSQYDDLTLFNMISKSTNRYYCETTFLYDPISNTSIGTACTDRGLRYLYIYGKNSLGETIDLTCYISNSAYTDYELGCWYEYYGGVISDLSQYQISLSADTEFYIANEVLSFIFDTTSVSPSHTYSLRENYDLFELQLLSVLDVELVWDDSFAIHGFYVAGEIYLSYWQNDGLSLEYYNEAAASYSGEPSGWYNCSDMDNVIMISNIEEYPVIFTENMEIFTPSSLDLAPLFEECTNHKFTYQLIDDSFIANIGTCSIKPTYYALCEYCLKRGTTTFEGDTLFNHSFTNVVVSSNATCTQAGVVRVSCSSCGLSFDSASECLGHNFVRGFCTRCGINIEPGLYSSNTLEMLRKGKINNATPIYTWDELTSDVLLVGGVLSIDNKSVSINTEQDISVINQYLTGDLVLPSDGSVTSIADSGFASASINDIYIPSCITSLGKKAFSSSKLKFVYLPDSITNITEGTFYCCDNLQVVSLGNNINSVGQYAFAWQRLMGTQRISIIFKGTMTYGDRVFERSKQIGAITLMTNAELYFPEDAFYEQFFATIYVPRDLYDYYSEHLGSVAKVDIVDGEYIAIVKDTYGDSGSSMFDLVLPENTIYIDGLAFKKSIESNTRSVTIWAEQPPALDNAEVLEGLSAIYVKADCVDAYKNAEGWSTLADKIQPIN